MSVSGPRCSQESVKAGIRSQQYMVVRTCDQLGRNQFAKPV